MNGPRSPLLYSIAIAVVTMLLTAGCVIMSTSLQPVNESVNAVLTGEDCNTVLLGFGFGHSTVEQAQRTNVGPADMDSFDRSRHLVKTPITKIRVITLYEEYALLGGQRCLQVVGEP